MQDSIKIPVFPTNLFLTNIYNSEENEKYKEKVLDLSKNTEGQQISNVGGWQSDKTLWKDKIFEPLLEKFYNYFSEVLKEENISQSLDNFFIPSLWANINPKGGGNIPHTHPGSFMSAIYYVDVNEENSYISFQDPRTGKTGSFPHALLTQGDNFIIKVSVGDLLIFPSWLHHYVNPNPSDKKRISISFNINFRLQ